MIKNCVSTLVLVKPLCHFVVVLSIHFRSILWDAAACYHPVKEPPAGDSFSYRLDAWGQRLQSLLDNKPHSASTHRATRSAQPLGRHPHRWSIYMSLIQFDNLSHAAHSNVKPKAAPICTLLTMDQMIVCNVKEVALNTWFSGRYLHFQTHQAV